jgi:hypothetical protein
MGLPGESSVGTGPAVLGRQGQVVVACPAGPGHLEGTAVSGLCERPGRGVSDLAQALRNVLSHHATVWMWGGPPAGTAGSDRNPGPDLLGRGLSVWSAHMGAEGRLCCLRPGSQAL